MRLPSFAKTVRFRLSFWYSGLLLVFGVTFVTALNLAVRMDQPHAVLRGYQVNEVEWQPVRTGPGEAISGFTPVITPRYILEDAENQIKDNNVERLRYWSLLALLVLAVSSGVGGYVLSGMMLRPIRDMTKVASEISGTNLSRRLNHQGPDDELSALARTFDSMIDRLEGSFERQRQFVQDASHELRTPLAAIRMNIEVTEMDADATVGEYKELLETVKGQTDRLTRLTEDLLFLTSENGDRPDFEPTSVGGLLREVASQLAPMALARDVTITVAASGETIVETSPDLLYRCVLNLVDNAIKYSGRGSTVTLGTVRDARGVVISVSDNGAGIEAEALPRLFDRFYRVDKGRNRREGGSGLGLSIVREIVRTIHGQITVESAPGTGTAFTITLPDSADPW